MTIGSDHQARDLPVIVIVGGGVSGTAVAFHLLQRQSLPAGQLFIFEPRERLGAGLAYDTQDPAHRINVPAAKMSLLPDDLEHFQRWLQQRNALADDEAAVAANGNLFPRRSVFGNYINSMIHPFVEDGRVVHVRQGVERIERAGGRWAVTGAAGQRVDADILVIATSHPSPSPPQVLREALTGHPRFVPDPTRPNALAAIGAEDRVLVVGNGLTSADVIASLELRGHAGPVTAISRRGLRSRGHAAVKQEPFGDFASEPSKTALDLLRGLRAAIRNAEGEGRSWHAVIDQVRAQGRHVWQALPTEERRRLVRHLRPFWDVHRFRVAPQVQAVSDRAIESGRLEVLAASVAAVDVTNGVIDCTLQLSRSGRRVDRQFDAVVVTTGPGHRGILQSQGWIEELSKAGYLAMDSARLGFACDTQSRALAADGTVVPSLFISGPLARGTFGELMGLPEVVEHAVLVAEQVAGAISGRRHGKRKAYWDSSAA
ncbi:SidA/IucD/PvdA family monooxygenase [Rhizobium sp. P40RR-XXII]|uniref:FAD/NAD(P)-binding protein n=1 Tax=unclassified Rhizobium TaxID=2613769 RepID=UPI0014573314|nr:MULTISPECIES: FAD/NAD(P)-binding protein [unclassified Rhizobium]NLR83199.1 SidA/IucD/PvdA family monooxygenase [Rhizobium sp. P28RR-XV]NLS15619.1 SidA/IucD/PvdA family monooxygenase [Rhizobium sp. P40RR-XXII]